MRRLIRKIYRSIRPEPIPTCDEDTLAVLRGVLRPDSNTVDIGCNRGQILRELVRLTPAGRHFAFEPIPRLAGLLRRRFPDVECYEIALSDRKGTTRFHHFMDKDGFSGIRRRNLGQQKSGAVREIEVRTDRLDDVLPAGVRIDLMKIDVEGAEFDVLRGAEATLRGFHPVVIFECGRGGLELYGHTPRELFSFLEGCQLSLRLLRDWSARREPLSLDSFVEEVESKREYMFVASSAVPADASA